MERRNVRRVISLNIEIIGYADALSKIVRMSQNEIRGYICFANAHMVVEAQENESFRRQVSDAALVLADGVPLVVSLRFLYGILQERIAGMDAFPDLLKRSSELGLKVFFFGSTDGTLQKIIQRAKLEFPRLKVVGAFSPPFGQPITDPQYIDLINNARPHLVFVGLGCPKQEIWMATNSRHINSVLLGVGGAFPVYARMTKRAPLMLRKFALEWLFRLLQEPRRLFFRYFSTNSKFLFLLVKVRLGFTREL